MGLSDEKIASRADLLGRAPETIERNYHNLIRLLRQDYNNRSSGRDLILNQAQLLGNSPETIESSIQYLSSLGINYNNPFLLGTTVKNKRGKVAYLLRNLFDYSNLAQEQKTQAISQVYDLVRERPQLMIDSIRTLEKRLPRLMERVAQYQS